MYMYNINVHPFIHLSRGFMPCFHVLNRDRHCRLCYSPALSVIISQWDAKKSINMEDNNIVSFNTAHGFCADCGSILPLLRETGGVTCYTCHRSWGPEAFGNMAMSHVLYFNNINSKTSLRKTNDDEDNADGPIVERKCPQCKNDKMSYATLQLRSADEGQTVFYTCTKCKYKETENS